MLLYIVCIYVRLHLNYCNKAYDSPDCLNTCSQDTYVVVVVVLMLCGGQTLRRSNELTKLDYGYPKASYTIAQNVAVVN